MEIFLKHRQNINKIFLKYRQNAEICLKYRQTPAENYAFQYKIGVK